MTRVSATIWQSGMSSGVRLAAWMPAMRAVREDVALGDLAACRRAAVAWFIVTTGPRDGAAGVSAFAATSTMWASPRADRCVERLTKSTASRARGRPAGARGR